MNRPRAGASDAFGDYLEADMTQSEDEQFPPVPVPPQPETLTLIEYGVQNNGTDHTLWFGAYIGGSGLWDDGEGGAHHYIESNQMGEIVVRIWQVGPGRPIEIITNPDNPLNSAAAALGQLGGPW